jgi:hypothetical protein
MDGRMDAEMYGWMYVRTDGRMDEWVMDGGIERTAGQMG